MNKSASTGDPFFVTPSLRESINGIPEVRFIHDPGTREEDKFSQEFVCLHLAIMRNYYGMGGLRS